MDSIPASPQAAALRFCGPGRPAVCKYLPPEESIAPHSACPAQAVVFRPGPLLENIHHAPSQAASESPTASTATNSSRPLRLESRTPNIQSNPSQKNYQRALPRGAPEESALRDRAVFPHRQWRSRLRSETRLSLGDCDRSKTSEAQPRAACRIPREETFLLFRGDVQENQSITRRRLRLYSRAHEEFAPRLRTSLLMENSFGGSFI